MSIPIDEMLVVRLFLSIATKWLKMCFTVPLSWSILNKKQKTGRVKVIPYFAQI